LVGRVSRRSFDLAIKGALTWKMANSQFGSKARTYENMEREASIVDV